MNVLEKLKSRINAKIVRTSLDPLFGQLTFSKGVWLGEVLFAPVGRKVEVFIRVRNSPQPDVTDRHRKLFREAENRYPAMAQRAAQQIVKRYPYYTEEFTTERVWEEFTLDRIDIDEIHGELLLTNWYRSLTEEICRPHFTFRINEPGQLQMPHAHQTNEHNNYT